MKILFELVKIFDVEPFQSGNGDAFRFRLEVIREFDSEFYKGKVFRLETYRLQPTFPQANGCLPDWKNDALIYVADDMFDGNVMIGTSVKEVVDKFQVALSEIFKR